MTPPKKSSDVELELADLIGRLARRWHQLAERSFATLQLNHTEARLLSLLEKHGDESTQDSLSSELNVDRSNAGRALNRLENNGLVVRRKGELDGRTKMVVITDAGRAAVKEIARIRAEMAHGLFLNLSDSEMRATLDLLRSALADEAN